MFTDHTFRFKDNNSYADFNANMVRHSVFGSYISFNCCFRLTHIFTTSNCRLPYLTSSNFQTMNFWSRFAPHFLHLANESSKNDTWKVSFLKLDKKNNYHFIIWYLCIFTIYTSTLNMYFTFCYIVFVKINI